MSPIQSAGLLLYRETSGRLEVLLAHPGGPFWARKDEGAWTIPKGELDEGEDPLACAQREFEEETGFAPTGEAFPLAPLRQPSGKIVHAFAMRADFDPAALQSNSFAMEWPPKSGQMREYPEIDRAAWYTIDEAMPKILKGQAGFLIELRDKLRASNANPADGSA